MKTERQDAILEMLSDGVAIPVAEMAARLGVAEVTMRRDLLELEEAGYLRRTHGAAIIANGRALGRPYRIRERHLTKQKMAIARVAAGLVRSGNAITLDGGSTVIHMVEALNAHDNLTIVTPNLRTAWAVAGSKSISRPFRLIVSGGVVREDELSMSGEGALAHHRRMRVDLAFLGVAGVNSTAGITDYDFDDAEIKRAIVESARRVVVLADGTKIGAEDLVVVAEVGRIDMLITDTGAKPEAVADLRSAGLNVIQVDADDPASVAQASSRAG